MTVLSLDRKSLKDLQSNHFRNIFEKKKNLFQMDKPMRNNRNQTVNRDWRWESSCSVNLFVTMKQESTASSKSTTVTSAHCCSLDQVQYIQNIIHSGILEHITSHVGLPKLTGSVLLDPLQLRSSLSSSHYGSTNTGFEKSHKLLIKHCFVQYLVYLDDLIISLCP